MAERATVTARESVLVDRTPTEVFDFTQDYAHRSQWDRYVRDAEVLSDEPRRVRVRAPGIGTYTIEYRLFRRGVRTSAAFVEISSRWISGGGGSWEYEGRDGGTLWTQTNTFELKHSRLLGWTVPLWRRSLASSMRTAMAAAKRLMEAGASREWR